MRAFGLMAAAVSVTGLVVAGPALAQSQQIDKLTMVVFGPPSLGAFLPPVIKAKKFDEKNGLNIEFVERPPDAYTVQFNTGEFQVGGSAALLTVGVAAVRGVKVAYLFNVFDYWSYVVTSRPDIKKLKDIEGKELVGAKSTSSYRIFTWFAKQQGVDMSTVSVVNTAPPGLMGYALADRAPAIHMWDPGFDLLRSKKPNIVSLDLKIDEIWKKYTGSTKIPYLGVAAHQEWIDKNPKLVPKLYNTYKAAADWVLANPEEASRIIVDKGGEEGQKNVAALIRDNDRLGLGVSWAQDIQKELLYIYKVGQEVDLLPNDPGPSTLYSGPKQ
jgi:NitT/TauT family transport system substrate-binding protein